MNKRRSHFSRGYTLLEIAIALGLLGVVGGIIYTVLNGGMVLFSKNIAINYSNLAVRGSSMRMVQDIHESVGRSELVDSNLQPTPTSVKATPGVRFPLLLNSTPTAANPNPRPATRILSDSSGNKTINSVSPATLVSLNIPQQPAPPKVGDILVLPDINDLAGNTLTRTISAVVVGNPTTITVNDLGVNLSLSTDTVPDPTLVYIVRLAAYALVQVTPERSEIRFYPDASNVARYTVVNNNFATYNNGAGPAPAGPFSLDSANMVRVQLISINAETGNRNFIGDRMVLDEVIPPKCLILQSTNYN